MKSGINPANLDNLAGAFNFILKKNLQNTDDMLPAQIVAYDSATNLATVKILISIVLYDDTIVQRPQLASVPVLTYGGGGFSFVFPYKAGDLGWIKASDRDISTFLQSFKETIPATGRLHSFSDGVFIPDVMTGFTVATADAQKLVLQKNDGSVKIALSNTAVEVTTTKFKVQNSTAELVSVLSDLQAQLNTLASTLQTDLIAVVGNGAPTAGATAGIYSTVATQISAIKTKIDSFKE